VKRQLELVYPDKHQLDIDQNETTYSIRLKITVL